MNEIKEIAQLNAQIERNATNRRKADMERQEAAQEARAEKALMACRLPVTLSVASWLCAAMGLASTTLAMLITLPCLCAVCYLAGTAK